MPDSFLLRDWQSFYLLTGTAGATLIGLIFLAISLGARLVPAEDTAPLRAFVVPIVTHFGAVLLLSGLLLIPAYTLPWLGGTLLAGGLVGLAYDLEVARQMRRHHQEAAPLDWRHWLWHWLVPSAGFALVAAAGLGLLLGRVAWLPAAALGALALLYVGLRNAFDLFLWIARQTNR
jgi:hypothetical protein